MKNMSAWAIRNPIAPIVMFLVLTFVGVVSFIRLPVNLNPDISFPFVSVLVSQPGAAPVEIEKQILQKVEGAVATVAGVKNISSRAIEGSAWVGIEFRIGTPVDRAVSDVRDAVSRIRAELPQSILEPQVSRQDVEGGAIVQYAVSTSGRSPEALSWFVDNNVTKSLLGVGGVASVTRSGGVDREIRIDLDPGRMEALGVTAVDVNNALRALNQDAPGGRAQLAGGEQSIRVLGGAASALALGATQIQIPGGRFVRLSDIADVRDGVAEVRSIARLDGRPATLFSVFKAKGFSDVTTLAGVERKIAEIRAENRDVAITQIFTTVDLTKRSFRSSMETLIEGSVLAVIVVYFFLREWRSTAISAIAIPLSAVPTFAFMNAMGFTLNGVSLLALSLVAGVLVDDAIVEIENIVRHMHMGKSGYQAAIDAADEIGLAVVATSAVIIAVFLPVSFMGGITGQFFREFGLTVAAAVFFSLMVARLITPVIAAYTLRSDHLDEQPDGPLMGWYQRFLARCIRHRWKTVGLGAAVFAGSIVIFATALSTEFLPPSDNGFTSATIELPPGVRIEDTSRVSALAAKIIRSHPEVSSVVEAIGADDDGQVRNAELTVSLVPETKRKLTQKQFEEKVEAELKTIPDARVGFGSGGIFGDVTIYLVGDEGPLVEQEARKIAAEMRTLPQLRSATVRGDMPRPEIIIRPRLDVAAQLGVTVEAISQTMRIATLGDLPQYGAKFALADRQIPIRVSLVESARRDLGVLENLPVPTSSGRSVPLKAVADVSFGQGPAAIRRYNQSRRMVIAADLNHGAPLGDATDAVKKLSTVRNLPPGVRLVWTGNAENQEELFSNMLLALGAGILMVFAVLVLLFARVFQPITILSALPLSLAGVAIALLMTNLAVSLPVLIGILMLMGIVGKNSILLVDFAIEEMRKGVPRLEALLDAGHKRARPIVMTSVAMIAGMLPTALGLGGGDSSFRRPMAIAVIGGIITSTALTLVVVPATFTLMDDLEGWLGPLAAKILAPRGVRGQAVKAPGGATAGGAVSATSAKIPHP